MNACKQRQATTGSWFVQGRLFEDWKGHANSFLWLHGIGTFSMELLDRSQPLIDQHSWCRENNPMVNTSNSSGFIAIMMTHW
jgi:hypothetical protein